MKPSEVTSMPVGSDDLLIRRSRVRNPPGSLELDSVEETAERGILRDGALALPEFLTPPAAEPVAGQLELLPSRGAR